MTKQQGKTSTGLHILVAEDNKVNQMVTNKLLEKLGHTCAIAEDGQKCLDMLATGDFDLVLMDCVMPNMDGLEATRQIRASGNTQLPIIAVTANAFSSDQQDCIDAGMDDYIDKPIDMNRMAALLEQWAKRLGKLKR